MTLEFIYSIVNFILWAIFGSFMLFILYIEFMSLSKEEETAFLRKTQLINIKIKREQLDWELEKIKNYKKNWDSEGGMPISAIVITKVETLLGFIFKHGSHLVEYLDLYANNNGTISLEFENEEKDILLHIEIGKTNIAYQVFEGSDLLAFSNNCYLDVGVSENTLTPH